MTDLISCVAFPAENRKAGASSNWRGRDVCARQPSGERQRIFAAMPPCPPDFRSRPVPFTGWGRLRKQAAGLISGEPWRLMRALTARRGETPQPADERGRKRISAGCDRSEEARSPQASICEPCGDTIAATALGDGANQGRGGKQAKRTAAEAKITGRREENCQKGKGGYGCEKREAWPIAVSLRDRLMGAAWHAWRIAA